MSGEAHSSSRVSFLPDTLQVHYVLTAPRLGGSEASLLPSFTFPWRTGSGGREGVMTTSLPLEYTPFALSKQRTSPKPHRDTIIDWKTSTKRNLSGPQTEFGRSGAPKSTSVGCAISLLLRLALSWWEYLRDLLLEEENGKQSPTCWIVLCVCVQIHDRSEPRGIAVLDRFLHGAWVCSCSRRPGRKEALDSAAVQPPADWIYSRKLLFVNLYRL